MKIKDIMCEKCNYTTATPRHLQEYIKSVHDEIRDELCDQCEMTFSKKATLQKHVLAVLDKEKNSFQIFLCAA